MAQCQITQSQVSKDLDQTETEVSVAPSPRPGRTFRYHLNRPSRDADLRIRMKVEIRFYEDRAGRLQAGDIGKPSSSGLSLPVIKAFRSIVSLIPIRSCCVLPGLMRPPE